MEKLSNETVENIGYCVSRIHKILEGAFGAFYAV